MSPDCTHWNHPDCTGCDCECHTTPIVDYGDWGWPLHGE